LTEWYGVFHSDDSESDLISASNKDKRTQPIVCWRIQLYHLNSCII